MTTITLKQEDLASALSRVRHAMSKEETRYYLCGVYVHADKEKVHFVATDGHRLARVSIPLEADCSAMVPGTIPAVAIADMLKAMPRGKRWKNVELTITPTKATLASDEGTLVDCILIDGTFPDYMRVIPTGEPKIGIVHVPAEQFLQAVTAVTAYRSSGEENSRAIKLIVADDTLKVTSGGPDLHVGCGKQVSFSPVSADVHDIGHPTFKKTREVGFNGDYLKQLIKAADAFVLQFYFNDPGSSALFKASGDENAIFVLMPMRI